MEGRRRYGGFEGVKPKEEQIFHQSRWKREAALINARNRRVTSMEGAVLPPVTADDVMHAEADRDNAQYEKWKSQEYRESDAQLQEVVRDWKAVRDNSHDKPKEFRMVQIMLGAGVQSAQGAAQLLALEDMGLTKYTHTYVGSSGASGPILYAAEGRAGAACAVFEEDATTTEFLDKRGFKPKLDTRVIARVMRSKGPKGVNIETVKKSSAEVIALITNTKTGKAELKDMKQMDDPIDACEASSAIPMFRPPVDLDGQKYIDGAFADVPLEEIIKQTKPTHILIHPNKAFDLIRNFDSGFFAKFGLKNLSRPGSLSGRTGSTDTIYTAAQLGRMKERVGDLLRKIGEEHGGVKIAVLWPPEEEMDALSNEPDAVRRGMLESYRKTISDFGEKQPETVRFLPVNDNMREAHSRAQAA